MYLNTTVIIVTFKSEKVIYRCLENLSLFKEILILDNSNDKELKKNLEKKYEKVRFFNSKYNLGYSRGHNYLMRLVKTDYALLISPDAFIDKSEFIKIEKAISKINNDFAILAPYDFNTLKANYGMINKVFQKSFEDIYQVDYVNGFFLFMNLQKIFKAGLFDKNFFLYNEDIDLCNRIQKCKDKIYILKNLKVEHLSSASSDIGSEYDKCKNWHWFWSKFYLEKKNNGYLISLLKFFPKILKLILRCALYFLFSKREFLKNFMRLQGLFSCILGKKSYYRPKIFND